MLMKEGYYVPAPGSVQSLSDTGLAIDCLKNRQPVPPEGYGASLDLTHIAIGESSNKDTDTSSFDSRASIQTQWTLQHLITLFYRPLVPPSYTCSTTYTRIPYPNPASAPATFPP